MNEIVLGILTTIITFIADKKLISIEDNIKLNQIKNQITIFNRKFDNTVLDRGSFETFINQSNVVYELLNRVFFSYRSGDQSDSEFIENIAARALSAVNEHAAIINWPIEKDDTLFIEYFADLLRELKEIRDSLPSLSDSAAISIQTDIMSAKFRETQELIKDAIGSKNVHNVFADDTLTKIENLVDLAKYDMAESLISECLIQQDSLSKDQRVFVIYQKAIIELSKKKGKQIEVLVKQIKQFDTNSPFLIELEYQQLCAKKDLKALDTVLARMEEAKYSFEAILLRRMYYHLITGDIEFVERQVHIFSLDNEAFNRSHLAHFLLAVVHSRSQDYSKSRKELELAFQLKNLAIYKYNITMISYLEMINQNPRLFRGDMLTEISNLLTDFEDIEYFTIYLEDKEIVRYWTYRIDLVLILNVKEGLIYIEKLQTYESNIDEFKGIIANIYLANGMYDKVIELLENYAGIEPLILRSLFLAYNRCEMWDNVVTYFEKLKDSLEIDSFLNSQYLYAKSHLIDYSETRVDVIGFFQDEFVNVDAFLFLLPRVLENNDEVLFKEILEIIYSKRIFFNTRQLFLFCKILSTFGKYTTLRKVIFDHISDNEGLMDLYVKSFDDSFEDLNQDEISIEVDLLYSKGCRYRSFLGLQIKVEIARKVFKKAIKTLDEFRNLFGVDVFYSYMYIYTRINLRDYSNLTDQINCLLANPTQDRLSLVSVLFSLQNNFNEAQNYAIRAYYLDTKNPSQTFLTNVVSMNFRNIGQKNASSKNITKIETGMVVTLRGADKERCIVINKDDTYFNYEGEVIDGCENYGPYSSISTILFLSNGLGAKIDLDGKTYEVVSIEEIYQFFSKRFFELLMGKYPDNETIKPIKASNIEDAIDELKNQMLDHNEHKKNSLDLYNFKSETGIPLSTIGGHDPNTYADTIFYLLQTEVQFFFTGEVYIEQSESYTLTLSSLIVLVYFSQISNISTIKHKISITRELYNSIQMAAKDINEMSESQSGMLHLLENNQLGYHEYAESEKKSKKDLWIQLMTFVSSSDITIVETEPLDNEIFELIPDMWNIDDVGSIDYCQRSGSMLICDDLFVRKIHRMLKQDSKSNNVIGLLISENILDNKELLSILVELSKSKYLYCVNESVLINIFSWINSIENESEQIMLIDKLKKVLVNLVTDDIQGYNNLIMKEFIESITKMNVSRLLVIRLLIDLRK